MASAGPGQSLESGARSSNSWVTFCSLPRHTTRKVDQKQSSQDYSHMGCQHHWRWFNQLCPKLILKLSHFTKTIQILLILCYYCLYDTNCQQKDHIIIKRTKVLTRWDYSWVAVWMFKFDLSVLSLPSPCLILCWLQLETGKMTAILTSQANWFFPESVSCSIVEREMPYLVLGIFFLALFEKLQSLSFLFLLWNRRFYNLSWCVKINYKNWFENGPKSLKFSYKKF